MTKKAKKKVCTLIQWAKVCVDKDMNLICPRCGEPAELILGIFANPCYAHAPKEKKKS